MGIIRAIRKWFACPSKLSMVRGRMSQPGAVLLDVGCGNHSPSSTKKYFPKCVYHGIDKCMYHQYEADIQCMDKFYDIDMDDPHGLDVVDTKYDAIICNHLLEHLADPYSVVERLAGKLKPGGIFYIEGPSPRSLKLPRAAKGFGLIRGTLNFYDDDSHHTFVDLFKVAEILIRQGLKVSTPKTRRTARGIALLPYLITKDLVHRGYIDAAVVWEVVGFAQYIVAERD